MLAAVRRRFLPLPVGAIAATSFSSTATAPAAAELASTYLVSCCGLSLSAAARAAAPGRLRVLASPAGAAQADSVLALFRRYGFSDADVTAVVRQLPIVLLSDPAKTLQPKLDFLAAVGISGPLLPKVVSRTPILLYHSVQARLAPLFSALRDALGGSENRVVAAVRQDPFVVRCVPKSTLFLWLPLLRDVHGVPAEDIAKIIGLLPGVVLKSPDRINEVADAVRRLGVEPGWPMFAYVFAVFSRMKPSTLESKMALYRRLGFDEECVLKLIRRYPASVAISEKKIQEGVGFLIGKAGLSLGDIISYPPMLSKSLMTHSRRCAVFAALRRAGKRPGQRQYRLPVALASTEKRFLRLFVQPHTERLPDVLRAMKGEIPFDGFHGSDEKPNC